MTKRSNITLKIDAEDADAVKSFLKLTQAERNLEMQTRKTNQRMKEKEERSKKAAGGMNALAAQAKTAVTGLIGFGAVAGVLKKVQSEIIATDQALVQMAKRANEKSKGIKEFAQLVGSSPEAQKLTGEVIIGGAQRGVAPDVAGRLAQPIFSAADADASGKLDEKERKRFKADFSVASKLSEAGVDEESVLKIFGSGVARGQSLQESADLLIKAADTSQQGPATFAKSISATSEFTGQKDALAILSGLTVEQSDPGKLPAAMERLGRVLGPAADTGKAAPFSEKFGLVGLSEVEKIQALRQHALETGDQSLSKADRLRAFTEQLPAEKGLSQEEATELGRVIRQSGKISDVRAGLEEGAEGRLKKALSEQLANPFTGPSIISDRQKALAGAAELVGPKARDAQARLNKRLVGGTEAIAEGRIRDIDEGGAEKQFFDLPIGSQISEIVGRLSPGMRAAEPVRPSQVEAERRAGTQVGALGAQDELVAELRKSNETMAELAASNRELARVQKGRVPVGGARSNAEEAR